MVQKCDPVVGEGERLKETRMDYNALFILKEKKDLEIVL